jgi:hypothetical protein
MREFTHLVAHPQSSLIQKIFIAFKTKIFLRALANFAKIKNLKRIYIKIQSTSQKEQACSTCEVIHVVIINYNHPTVLMNRE